MSNSKIFNVIVGTAGHIDHGKSSLVRKLTDIDPDRLKEEKDRGLTIDLGFAPFVLPNGQYVGIIDVPGHEKFIKNMVAGATGIDFVVLIVAADDGVMPQTREHLEIMQLLNIKKGMVALTKIDLVDEDLVELAVEELKDFLVGTFLQDAPICPVSSTTGKGFESFKSILIEQIQNITPHTEEGLFRMPIQRVFSSHGHGTVITGIPISGKVKVGDELEILPHGVIGRVKKIQAYGQNVSFAQAGHSTALNVKDIDYKKVVRGNVAAVPGYFQATKFIDAKLKYLAHLERPLTHSTPVRFHSGTSEEMGKLAVLGKEILEPGEEGYIQIRLENPVVLVPEDRFMVRLSSPMITIGGGVILHAGEKKLKRFRSKVISNLEEKEESLGKIEKKVEILIKTASSYAIKDKEILKKSLQEKQTAEKILSILLQKEKIYQIPPNSYIHFDTLVTLCQKVEQTIANFFKNNPYKINVPVIQLRNVLRIENLVLDFVLESLLKKEKIERYKDQVRIPKRTVQLTPEEQELKDKIVACFLESKFSPPTFSDLSSTLNAEVEKWEHILHLLEEEQELIKIEKNLFFHQKIVMDAEALLVKAIREKGQLISADFRDQLETSRKYIIPLLDYFDKKNVTVRDGNTRVLHPNYK